MVHLILVKTQLALVITYTYEGTNMVDADVFTIYRKSSSQVDAEYLNLLDGLLMIDKLHINGVSVLFDNAQLVKIVKTPEQNSKAIHNLITDFLNLICYPKLQVLYM